MGFLIEDPLGATRSPSPVFRCRGARAASISPGRNPAILRESPSEGGKRPSSEMVSIDAPRHLRACGALPWWRRESGIEASIFFEESALAGGAGILGGCGRRQEHMHE